MPTSKCEEPHKVQWSINLHDWVPPTDASFEFCATAHNPAIMSSVNGTKKDGTKEEVPCPKSVGVGQATNP
ncbi:hypothetical protein TNCV_4803191 [Trichonephila clavipes]|nr:hypothetical protein TNCV_4803191 [Trichonephila clavipes]